MNAIALALALALSAAPKPAPNKKTQLKLEIKPSTAVFYLDGKRKGTGGKVHTFTVEPGNHSIKIVNKKDEHQEMISVKKGETKNWQWSFEDDRQDKADANAAKKGAEGSGNEGSPGGEAPESPPSE